MTGGPQIPLFIQNIGDRLFRKEGVEIQFQPASQIGFIPGNVRNPSWLVECTINPLETQYAGCNDIELRITPTPADDPRGTVILSGGGAGDGWYISLASSSSPISGMVSTLLDEGFNLVEVRSRRGMWAYGTGESFGAIQLASRYAFIAKCICDVARETYPNDPNHLLIAQGNCAGSAQISFALCYFDLDIDLVNLGSPLPPCPRCPPDPFPEIELDQSEAPEETRSPPTLPIFMERLRELIEDVVEAGDVLEDRFAAIQGYLYRLETMIYKEERDEEQLWCYLAIRHLIDSPINDVFGTPALPFSQWAKKAQPLLLPENKDKPAKLDYPHTRINFLIGKHEELAVIHEMTQLYYERITSRHKHLYGPISDMAHKSYNSQTALRIMTDAIINAKKLRHS